MIEVVAGLIRDKAGSRFMICQRPECKARGLMWEFVGGKVEAGETKPQALIRECKEELDVTVKVNDEFTSVEHKYPDVQIRLTIFNAEIISGEPKLIEHNALTWITPDEIKNFNFCPADEDVLKKIIDDYNK